MTKTVQDLKDGDKLLVLRSACCGGTTKGVEYGDHIACRVCRKTNRTWVRKVTPFRTVNLLKIGSEWVDTLAGPAPELARDLTPDEEADPEGAGLFWWG